MKRKTCLRVFLTLVLALTVFASMAITASAASITVEIGSSTINISEEKPTNGVYTVDVPINVTANSGFLTVSMDVTYPTEFELTGWTEGDIFPADANITSDDADDLTLNPFTVMYFTYDANVTATGNLITLTFECSESIEPGEYDITAVVNDAVAQGADANAFPDTITDSFTVSAGKIVVEEFPNGECGDNLSWILNPNTGVLTISGTGDMWNWSTGNYAPWYEDLRDNIKSVVIGEGVTSIGDQAFYYCTEMTDVDIPDSITSIGSKAFYYCNHLTSLDIPDSVTSIGSEAFSYVLALPSITVDEANTNYSNDEYGVLFDENKTTLIQYPIGNTRSSYTIPESVTSIGARAFGSCRNLTSITVPESVTSIGNWAFYAENPNGLTIYGYAGTAVETYAASNGIEFVDITPEYDIVFKDKDGNDLPKSGKYKKGVTVELPVADEYPHFTFLGWSTGVQGEALITEDFIADKTLTLTATYEEDVKYTVIVEAAAGGLVIYEGETGSRFEIEAYEGTVLTFEAVDDPADPEDNMLRNWYDWSTGSAVSITGSADGLAPTTLEYTVTKNITIDANFINVGHRFPVRLVAFAGRNGYISTGSGNTSYFDEYVDSNEPTTLTAIANDGYAPAYWVRLTQDSNTEVLIETGAVVKAYPLGGSVFYQPVFKEASAAAIDLYIDSATSEIFAAAPSVEEYTIELSAEKSIDGVVNVYVCTKGKDSAENNAFTAYDIDGNPVEEVQTPAYKDNIIISKTETNENPLWTLKLGDKEFIASYKDSFSFNYMFEAGTSVEVYEKALNGEAAPAISTVTNWTEDGITRFTGLFALPEGYTLVNHGIMMDQSRALLVSLEGNTTGELNVSASTIVGRVTDNEENATPLFTVAKRLANEADVWYGRAFMVYTDGTTTYVKYADDVLPSLVGAEIVEGETPGNEDIYGPLYWDDSIAFEN